MNKNIEKSVPANYVLVKHVDAKTDKKIMIVYTILSFVPLVVLLPVFYLIAKHCSNFNIYDNYATVLFAVSVTIIFYIILHELVHGLTYKCFTGAKLTFGISLTVAFCGVPDVYVRKKASIAALVMPLTVFSIIFGGLTVGLWFVSPLYGIAAGVVFAVHLGGCVGDLHWTIMYLTKYRHCNTLMRDTGPEQWLYIPKTDAERYNIPYTLVSEI